MDKFAKYLTRFGLNLLILVILGSLLGIWPFLSFGSQKGRTAPETLKDEGVAIIQGNSLLAISKPAGTEISVIREIKMVITAYSSSPLQTDSSPYITAAGTWVKEGLAANNLLPFGTKVRIPEIYGDKVFVIEDRMNSRKGYYHLDIWFPSYLEAKSFGVKRTYIEIIKES